MLPAGRVPIRIINREQPNFPKGLQDCTSSSLRGFCGLSRIETVQVPKHLVSREFPNRFVRNDPATDLLVTLAHWAANPAMDRLSRCLTAQQPSEDVQSEISKHAHPPSARSLGLLGY
jgi:hypothetical protein